MSDRKAARQASAIHPFVDVAGPIGLAHRGGGREAAENSLSAFRNAAALGFNYFETDVRATSDGKVMIFHDAELSRVTDRVGRISALPYSEVKRAKIGNVDKIMRLDDLLDEFPEAFLNIDVKDDHSIEPFIKLIKRRKAQQRICVATFSASRLRRLRAELGSEVASSLAPPEVAGLIAYSRLGPLAGLAGITFPKSAACVQVPISKGGVRIITRSFISAAHRRNLKVHVWTINDEQVMRSLLDMGVDGIVTDRPTVLARVLRSYERKALAATPSK